jgi:hypothetical protein
MIMPVFGLEFSVWALYLFFEDGKKAYCGMQEPQGGAAGRRRGL